jgi:hypothetical protein
LDHDQHATIVPAAAAAQALVQAVLGLAVEVVKGNGGLAGTRTLDQCLKRALLYRLSYQPEPFRQREIGFTPRSGESEEGKLYLDLAPEQAILNGHFGCHGTS